MRSYSAAAYLVLSLAAVHASTAQRTHPAITAADARTRLYIIADDSMRGRAAGDIGDVRATDYIAREMKRLHLVPLGENGTYFQTVPVEFTSIAGGAWLGADNFRLKFDTDFTVANPVAARAAPLRFRDLDGRQLIYGGAMGDTASMISAADAAGRIVILGPKVLNGRRQIVDRPGTASSPKLGTAAALFFAQTDRITLDPRYGTSPARAVATDTTPARVGGSMTIGAAERLFGKAMDQLRPGDLGPVIHGDVRLEHVAVRYPARNVIGMLRGSDSALAREFVVVGSHNDHVGIAPAPSDHDSVIAFNRVYRPMGMNSAAEPDVTTERDAMFHHLLDSLHRVHRPRLDSISNGADDDGSGTVGLLEIAEAMVERDERPKRSIVFASFTAEEAGLVGSAYFTDHPPIPLDSIVAELQMDHISRGRAEDIRGGGPRFLTLTGAARRSAELQQVIERVNSLERAPFDFDLEFDAPNHPLQIFCRSDHWNFARFGVPAVLFFTGLHPDYHQVTDEPRYADYDKLTRVAQLVHDVAMSLADRPRGLQMSGPKPDPRAACRQ